MTPLMLETPLPRPGEGKLHRACPVLSEMITSALNTSPEQRGESAAEPTGGWLCPAGTQTRVARIAAAQKMLRMPVTGRDRGYGGTVTVVFAIRGRVRSRAEIIALGWGGFWSLV
jgi:hypothetical protein